MRVRRALALAILLVAPGAMAVSNFSAQAPAAAKAARVERLAAQPADMVPLRLVLALPDVAQIDAVKAKNAQPDNKRLQIGIGRDVPPAREAGSAALAWRSVPGGIAAHWEVVSPTARALRLNLRADRLAPRVEIRFSGLDPGGTVYGPVGAVELLGQEHAYWSPVLEGERALIEVFIPEGGTPGDASFVVAQVSHLFVSPRNPEIDRYAKNLTPGTSQSCEIDLICRSPADPALANVGKSVARMVMTSPGGGTGLCTGTLLNPLGGGFTPYFYSAAHCMSTQAEASNLETNWFFDRTGCGAGGVSPAAVALTGGATLLYANTGSDVLFLRLDTTPPAGAVHAGWDSTTLANGVALTGVHHPGGDLKKVSLATMGGVSGYGGGAGSDHLITLWNSTATGVTEGGSSGSGIFSYSGSDYRLRGGLHGGPSSCTATGGSLRDYYSRFDLAYPILSQYLAPAGAAGNLLFFNPVQFAAETAGSHVIPVSRINGSAGAVSVSYYTSSGTATSEVDFVPTSGTLTWADGDASPKYITVPVIADVLVETNEYWWLQLHTPTGGATIGGFNPYQLYITEAGVFPPAGAMPAGWSQSAGANHGWAIATDQALEGSQSLKSSLPPNTNAGGQRADIEVTLATGAGNVSFARKVSSESGFDFLRFFVDGALVDLWSGEVAFSVVTYPVTQGYHTFRWSYLKDGSVDGGQDAAWIDAVTLPATGLDPAADHDNDGIPNGVEAAEWRNPFAKDNDVFSPGAAAARLFAMQQYRDFLGREGDAAGIGGWASALTAGTYTRPMVIDAFVNSPEFGGFVAPVVRLYFAAFLRVPDYAGLTYNAGLVRSGAVSLKLLANFFATSPEFVARYGSLTNTQFVTLLYQNVLGRAPDAGGLAGWVSLLDGGLSRGQALLGFSDSAEYQAAMANEVLVTMMYTAMLRRTPEPSGFSGWLAFLDAGTYTREQVINGFFLSTEYRNRFLP